MSIWVIMLAEFMWHQRLLGLPRTLFERASLSGRRSSPRSSILYFDRTDRGFSTRSLLAGRRWAAGYERERRVDRSAPRIGLVRAAGQLAGFSSLTRQGRWTRLVTSQRRNRDRPPWAHKG